MMKRPALTLISLLVFATPAQALKLIVWDGDLQTKLGAGESSNGKFNVQLVKDYSGSVKIMFSQTADERSRNNFAGLLSSYDGLLKNGQLTLLVPDAEDKAVLKSASQAAPTSEHASNTSLTLAKFLQQFKLSVALQTTGQASNLFNLQSRVLDQRILETKVK